MTIEVMKRASRQTGITGLHAIDAVESTMARTSSWLNSAGTRTRARGFLEGRFCLGLAHPHQRPWRTRNSSFTTSSRRVDAPSVFSRARSSALPRWVICDTRRLWLPRVKSNSKIRQVVHDLERRANLRSRASPRERSGSTDASSRRGAMNASRTARHRDTVTCSTITSGSSTLATPPPRCLPVNQCAIFDSSSFWNCAADGFEIEPALTPRSSARATSCSNARSWRIDRKRDPCPSFKGSKLVLIVEEVVRRGDGALMQKFSSQQSPGPRS